MDDISSPLSPFTFSLVDQTLVDHYHHSGNCEQENEDISHASE